MAEPHRTFDDEDDLYMDAGAAEDNAMAQAIQNSLESFPQVWEEISQIPNDTVEVPRNTCGSPQLSLSSEEIAEDERRRDRELYGPPTPPRTTRAVTSLNPIPDPVPSRASDKTNNNSAHKTTKYFDETSKNKSEDDSKMYDIRQAAIKTVNRVIVERYFAMKGVSRTAKTKNLSITDKLLALKIGASFETVDFPTGDSPLKTVPSISHSQGPADVADTDPYIQDDETLSSFLHASCDQNSRYSPTDHVTASKLGQNPPAQEAEMAGMVSSQMLDSAADSPLEQLVRETEDNVNEDENVAPTDSNARAQGSLHPAGFAAASDVADWCVESSRVGEHFDNTIARGHAAHLARIDAALDSHNAGLGAALEAARARGVTRGVIAPAPAPAAADSAGDEELERFLDESLISPRAGSEEDRPPDQTTRPQ